MIISVTRKHIQAGKQYLTRQCPVALAILDKHKPNTRVRVGCWTSKGTVFNGIQIDNVMYEIPRSVSRFIKNFDNDKYPRKNLKPFNFRLVKREY